MALTLTVEDGSGKPDANAYIDVGFADAYHEADPHSEWSEDEERKKQGIITATRMLDQQWIWNGYKSKAGQALQWPRMQVKDPDRPRPRTFQRNPLIYSSDEFPENEIPAFLKRATAALAAVILTQNREVEPQGQGLRSFALEGVLKVDFDLSTKAPILPEWLTAELTKYGSPSVSKSRTVRVVRT